MASVAETLSKLSDPAMVDDCETLIAIMSNITGETPTVWNIGTIGFGNYHYRYESGREGDVHTLGFYPRDGKITFYLMDGTARHSDQLKKLGKHSTSKACLYIKRLSDINIDVLRSVLKQSYDNIQAMQGQIHQSV